MRTVRGVSHFGKRLYQTPVLFRNFPEILGRLALAETGRGSADLVFRMRNGYTVHCPNADGARFPLYEVFGDDAYRVEELRAGVDPDAGVLDVGGQIGSFALAIAAAMPRATVHVYEASPTSASYVERNIVDNGLADRVAVHAEAMAATVGQFTFVDSGTASGHNGLTAPDGLGSEVTVPSVPFDEAVRRVGADVQIVKMDVEGAEYDIVLSSSPSSWASVRKVVMEYHPMAGHSLDELLAFFSAVGLEPIKHDPGKRAGLGVIWLARPASA